jgi:hypothetical protein
VATAVGIMALNEQTKECVALTHIRSSLVYSSGHCETETSDGNVLGTDRQWTDLKYSSGPSDTEPTVGTM